VLVVHSYDPDLSWTQQQKTGINQAFRDSKHNVKVYHEFLDAKRYPNLLHREAFLDYLTNKYKKTDLQLLMVTDDPGIALLRQNRDKYFPDLPVVFMGVNQVQPELQNTPGFTGVFENHSIRETILEAARQMNSNEVIVIADSTETGQATLREIESLAAQSSNFPKTIVFKDVTTDRISELIGRYSKNLPIYIAGEIRANDANRSLLTYEETVLALEKRLKNPLYSPGVAYLGHGIVGGKILEGSFHATQAVQLSERILDGEPVDQVPEITEAKTQWIFDYEVLKRTNIDLNNLPDEATFINKEASFYEQYQHLVWYAATVFALCLTIIVILLEAVRRQRVAERVLEDKVSQRTRELSQALRDLKRTQAQLIQKGRLSSLGQLVGGIAHEFNNPLAFIMGNVEILEEYIQELLDLAQDRSLPDKTAILTPEIATHPQSEELNYIQQDLPKVLKSIANGADRIQTMVRDLQSFARSDESGMKPTDLNATIERTLKILKPQIGQEIQVIKLYGALPNVDCDAGAINQVLMQILLNAVEALSQLEKTAIKKITIKTESIKEGWVAISIEDTGPGISNEIKDQIFDPFFSTKPIGQGTGLGLSLSYQAIQQHHGHLICWDDMPVGSRFIIELPVDQPSATHVS